ncbi:LuxR family transcriptional regulator fused with ATPase domain [Amycolatopsis keratiniphila]|uniref:LuxR family transcriptional regulator fused with ATPase domain n=2 Tax=Amycolatopsis keratiniphila TaxID=129921 RepID=R4TAG6_9PSEU|nr:LuxR family transcriptional regulator fused with ATPase domain [Amycolatopsis keratiniphila]
MDQRKARGSWSLFVFPPFGGCPLGMVPSMPTIGTAPVFVARDTELAELVRVASRPPSVAVVEGEPGVGRSRLLEELAAHPALASRVVWSARCGSFSRPCRLAPLVDALLEKSAVAAAHAAGFSPVTGVLRRLVPEWSPWLPPFPENADAETVRQQEFRAVREVLTGCGPAVLVLDDVHCADDDTWEFLRGLAASPAAALSVVVSAAICGPRRFPPLRETAAHLSLTAFTDVQVRTLLDASFGRCAPDFAEAAHRRTSGIAVDLTALVQSVGDTAEALSADRLASATVPPIVRSRVSGLMEAIGSAARDVVRAAAVLGSPAGEPDLGAVAASAGIDGAITEAVEAGLLRDLGRGRYVSGSPLIAEAVYALLPGPQRCAMHGRAAARLAASAEPFASLIARHARLAGDIAAWTQWTGVAVDNAIEDGRTEEASRLLEAALRDADLPRTARESFAVRLGRELPRSIAHAGTVRLLREILREWPLSKAARGEIRVHLGQVLINQVGKVEAGRLEIELGAADLGRRQALLARGLVTLALPHIGTVPVEENFRWLDEAEQASKGEHDAGLLAAITANRLSARMQIADPEAWHEIADLPRAPESAEVCRQVARTYINLADAVAWNGHYPVARAYLATARRLIRDDHQPYLDALADGTELRLDLAMGEWASVAEKSRAMLTRVDKDGSLAAEPLLVLGWYEYGQHRPTAALRSFDAAFALSAGSVPVQASAYAGRVAVHQAGKDLQAARRLAEFGLETVRRKNNWVWAAELMPFAVRTMLGLGQHVEARELLAEFRQGIDGKDAPVANASALLCRGMLTQARGETLAAGELLVGAAQAYSALPLPYFAAYADELAAGCFSEAGVRERAVASFTTAETTYARLGAAVDALRCRRSLRRCDPEMPRRGRKGYGEALSPRELEVARLAAQNLTNREIGERLFLSPRTVEIHVGRALRKLGLPSRTVLTADLLSDIP